MIDSMILAIVIGLQTVFTICPRCYCASSAA